MKKILALLLAGTMALGLAACGGSSSSGSSGAGAADSAAAESTAEGGNSELEAAAKEEGTLVVYGSCEEEYLAAACENFQEKYGIEEPQDWADLLDSKYKGLIWLSNYNTAGTAKLVVNTMIQKYGHDEGIQYLVDLDKNVQVYTKSGSGPSKNVGTGECVVGIGFLHDGHAAAH